METMTVEELRAYLEALQAAVYVPGQGFRVQTPDGQTVILSPEQVKQTTDQVNARIGELTTNVFEAVGGAIASGARAAAENLAQPGKTAAELRAEQVQAGQSKLSKANKKLVDDLLEARRKRDDTARQVAGLAPSQGEKSEADIDRWVQRVADAEAALAKKGLALDDQNQLVRIAAEPRRAGTPPGTVTGASRRIAAAGGGEDVGPRTTGLTADQRERVAPPRPRTEPVTSATAAPTVNRNEQATYVSTQLQSRGLPDTPENRRMLRAEFQRTGGGEAWKEALQKFFPSYASTFTMADATNVFGADLINLMVKVSDPKSGYDLTTTAGLERIKAELRGTTYWQTTVAAARTFDQSTTGDQNLLVQQTKNRIASTYGDLNMDEQTLIDVSRVVARNGLTGISEQQAIYNAVFRQKDKQVGIKSALQSEQANAIRQLGKAYGYQVSDSQIQSILTGTPDVATGQTLTEDSLRQRLRSYVKGAMPHLTDQIDAGLTLEDIGASYKRLAGQLLEKDESQIDMFSGPYLRAFGDPKNGQLSLSDWVTTVKSDPTFGWQYTKQANDQATSIGLSLARAFGKVQ